MAAAPPPPPHNPAFPYNRASIFATTSSLAAQHGAINLGQGFPEEDGPDAVKVAAAEALTSTPQQYAHPAGLPALRAALAAHEAGVLGLDAGALDPGTQVLVTAGATEALAATILGLVSPGDEVVVIDPAYDSYAPLIRCAGGVAVPVRLVPPPSPPRAANGGGGHGGGNGGGGGHGGGNGGGGGGEDAWSLPSGADLAAAFRPGKTRAVILNTPHNPTGHCFTPSELAALADQVTRCGPGCIAICDEVYASLALPPHSHTPLAALPGMAPHCLRIGSAGKTFSLTGWKVGWLTGPAPLVAAVAGSHQFLTFSVPGALQAGVAHGLTACRPFIEGLGADLAAKRARLAPALAAAGFRVLPSEATYFLTADAAGLMRPGEDDVSFCVRLVTEGGVAAIPLSPFYTGPHPPTTLVRFCFAKRDATLDAAAGRLAEYFQRAGAAVVVQK